MSESAIVDTLAADTYPVGHPAFTLLADVAGSLVLAGTVPTAYTSSLSLAPLARSGQGSAE